MATKTIITLILTLLLSPAVVSAQKAAQPADSKAAVSRMAKELGLSDTQRSQVETILNNEKKKVDAVFNEEKILDNKMRQKSGAGKK
ncbi:hypothetical protein [Nitrosomonas sp.]|uniref:hypothetical protein n=1 Tax=Nitrosomonas sp. TaxID=42353 RepID=UPI002636EE7F|nr:hypothetical protein [Nitrosomonas sp.]